MKKIFFYFDSLRKQSKSTLKKGNKDVWKTLKRQTNSFKSTFSSNQIWRLIIPIIFLFLLISSILPLLFNSWNFTIFNFLEFESPDTVLEQRISNVATIIGVTLTVSTIMISNIAEKKKENYEAIFQETLIYPIVYYALTLLGYLILISVFRKFLKDKGILINLVIVSHYLVVFLIIFIGFLFYNIIKFFNVETLKKIHIDSLKAAFVSLLKEDVISNKNTELYNEKLKEIIKERQVDWFNKQSISISPHIYKNEYISDVQLYKLSLYLKLLLKKHPDKVFFSANSFLFGNDNNLLIEIETPLFSNVYNETIQKYFVIDSFDTLNNNFKSALNNYFGKKQELIDVNNSVAFDESLKVFEFIIDISTNAYQDYSVKYFKSSQIEQVIDDIYGLFFEKFKKQINMKDKKKSEDEMEYTDISYNLSIFGNFIFQQIRDSRNKLSPIVFNSSLKTLHTLAYCNKQYQISDTTNIISLISPPSIITNKIKGNDLINEYYYSLLAKLSSNFFKLFETLIKSESTYDDNVIYLNHLESIGNEWEKDVEHLNLYKDLYTNDFKDSRLRLQSYYCHLISSLQAFIIWDYLQYNTQPDYMLKLLNKLKKTKYQNTEEFINYYCFLFTSVNQNNNYLNLGMLHLTNNKIWDWLCYCFIFEGLNTLWDTNVDLQKIEDIEKVGFISKHALNKLDNYDSIKSKWQGLIYSDDELFHRRYMNFTEILNRIILLEENFNVKLLSEAKLSEEIINNFKTNTYKKWEQGFSILHVFNHFNALKIVSSNENKVFFGIQTHILKEPFTEFNKSIYPNIYDFGLWAGEDGNEKFLEILAKNQTTIIKENVQEAIGYSINHLKKIGFSPNLIIVSHDILMSKFYKDEIEGFYVKPEVKREFSEIGFIDNIFIISIKNEWFNNALIVSDFSKAFELEIAESSDWYERKLQIDVSVFNKEMLEEELKNHREYWDAENKLTEEQLKAKILLDVKLRIAFQVDYNVLNPEAYQFISISEKN